MSQEAREATSKWLRAQGLRSDVSAEEMADLRSLLAPHKGFGILWSLVMFDRQEAALQLGNADLSTASGVSRASVLQGQIRAIDNIRELILDIADPPKNGVEQQLEDREGANNG